MPDDNVMDVLTRRKADAVRDNDSEFNSESMLPDLSSGYRPFSRADNKPVYTLHCILGRNGYRSFQYVHLDSESNFSVDEQGQVIRLRFCGSKTTSVTIRGRNLRRLYDYIHQHRMPWVMCVDRGRDFATDAEPTITSIEFAEVKEPETDQSQ